MKSQAASIPVIRGARQAQAKPPKSSTPAAAAASEASQASQASQASVKTSVPAAMTASRHAKARDSDPGNDDGVNLDSPSAIGRAVRHMLYEMDEAAIFLDPPEVFDDAIVGITEGDLGPVRVIYDSDRCVARMAQHHGWDWDEAMEFFSFNTLGTHVEGYPLFLAKPVDMPAPEPMASSEAVHG